MLPPEFQSPKTAISAAAFGSVSVYCLYRAFCHLLSINLDDSTALCGAESSWDLSLGNDCFRTGFLWPAFLLLISGVSVLSFCLCLVLPVKNESQFTSDSSSPFSRLSIGNMIVPARRPLGQVIVVDNRLCIGTITVILLAIQTALYYTWKTSSVVAKDNGTKDHLYSSAMAQLSIIVLLLSVICLSLFWRSNRMTYAGLFSSVIPVSVGIQLLSGLCEVYFSFITERNANVPIIGTNASIRSNLLVLTTTINLFIMFMFSFVQWRPIFYCASESSQNNSISSSYNSLSETDYDFVDADQTPFAHPSDLKTSQLADTPEQHCSLFDRLTFSWPNELLRRGAVSTANYSDLYVLPPEAMPISNWNRYRRNCKPGRPLLVALLWTYMYEIFIQLVLVVTRSMLLFASPFFLQRILRTIEFSQQGLSTNNNRSKYLDVLGLLFFSILSSLIYNQILWIARSVSIWMKGLFVAELTAKTLRRRGRSSSVEHNRKDTNSNAKDNSSDSNGKVINILTADFNKVVLSGFHIISITNLILTLFIGIWYLYKLLGVSALIGLVVSVLYIPLSKALLTRSRKAMQQQSAANDNRIATITETLHGIKAIKLFGWETRFLEKVDARREKQLSYMWSRFIWSTCIGASAMLNPIVILIIIFALYVVVFGNTLDAEIAFTSILVFQMVRGAINQLPVSINHVVGAYVAILRIDSYLDQTQAQDLGKRTLGQVACNELGFDCADLEWDALDNTGTNSGVPKSTGDAANGRSTESTPLLASTSNSQVAQVDNQKDIRTFSLKNIDVRFPLGKLSIVAGPTGSGKSSLLSALVGEMTLVRGNILLPTINPNALADSHPNYRNVIELSREGMTIHDIAYVAQEAWLRNATIRENILFGEPYNRERYEEVLRICALKPDLRILVAGDMSEVGERGITLSGGQKQRVALARAVYSSRRILLIDDCLSAVDAHTAKHILVECLAGNSKLIQGRTRVLVTHHVEMCLPHAQYIVMINNGRTTLKGTPDEFKTNDPLLLKPMVDVENKDNIQVKTKNNDKQAARYVNVKKSEDEYNKEHLENLAVKRGIDPDTDLSMLQGVLVKEEAREEGYVKFEVWKTFMQACGGKMFWTYLVMVLVASEGIYTLRSYWIRLWVASANSSAFQFNAIKGAFFAPNSPNDFSYSIDTPFWHLPYITHIHSIEGENVISNGMASSYHRTSLYWLGIYTLIGITSVAWYVLLRYSVFVGRFKIARKMHRQLIRSVIHALPRFHESTTVGRIINCFSRDMDIIDSNALDTIGDWFGQIISVLAIYFVISTTIPAFVIVAIVITGMFAMIAFYYLNTTRELKRLESNSMSPLLSLFGEIIQGTTTIRAFGIQHYFIKEAINRISAHNRPFYMVWSTNRWLFVRINATSTLIATATSMFILFNLDWIDAGMAGFILTYALTFSSSMLWVVRKYSDNEMNMNAIERIMQYLNIDQEAALETDSKNKPPAAWPKKGDLQVENIVVEYVPGLPVLHGVSLSVKHGEKVGVVGRTGSGKSTFSLALLRFLEASKGRILLDGIDISKLGLEDLRRNVTIIPQDPVLFNGTIRFNLDPFDEHPDELLWEALRRTHLVREAGSQANSTTSSIVNTDDKDSRDMIALERMSGIFTSLDAEIKENGNNLSAGQRQLVALARALVRRSKLIIMDEATASVDFDTDNRIQNTIRGPEFANSTLLCIAHRLRTIADYDRVLVMDNGSIAEFDTPYNLLKREDGIFRSMCKESGEYEHMQSAAASDH